MERFPLPPEVAYSYESGFSATHHGCDIFAPTGAPLVAVETGQAWSSIEPKGGKVVYLLGDVTGTRYFYGHLDSWALPLISATTSKPLHVQAGDELGTVGTSGNADGRPPHLHFQMHQPAYFGSEPATGESAIVDPFPDLLAADPKHVGTRRAAAPSNSGTSFRTGAAQAVVLFALLWIFTSKLGGRA